MGKRGESCVCLLACLFPHTKLCPKHPPEISFSGTVFHSALYFHVEQLLIYPEVKSERKQRRTVLCLKQHQMRLMSSSYVSSAGLITIYVVFLQHADEATYS